MTNEQLTALYASLCQKLGDLIYKKSQLEVQIQEVEMQLKGINLAAAAIKPAQAN